MCQCPQQKPEGRLSDGTGKSMQEAMDEVNMVVEGVYSAKAAASLAKKYDVPMPIVEEINRILFEGKDPKKAVDDLMLRESKIENSSLLWEKNKDKMHTSLQKVWQ